MTEYEKIEKVLLSLGWSCEQGKGDHMKFTKQGIPHTISIARSLPCNNRSYKNTIADIRRWEPNFTLDRPVQSKGQQPAEPSSSQNSAPSEDNFNYINEHAFIKTGEKVRYVVPENRDYSKLNDETSVMNIPYTVVEISGKDNTKKNTVTSPDDRITINVSEGHQHSIVVCPDELDAWELIRCSGCTAVAPSNISNWRECIVEGKILGTLCPDCQKKEDRLKDTISRIKKLALEYKDGDPQIFKNLEQKFDEITSGVSKTEPVIRTLTDEILNTFDTILADAKKELEKDAFFKQVHPSKPVKAKKPNLRDAFGLYKEAVSAAILGDQNFTNNEVFSIMSDVSYQFGKTGNLPVVTVQVNTKRQDCKILMSIILRANILLKELEKVYPQQHPAIRILYPSISFSQYMTFEPDTLKKVLNETEYTEDCDFISKSSKLEAGYLKDTISKMTLTAANVEKPEEVSEILDKYLTVMTAYLPDRRLVIFYAMDNCAKTDFTDDETTAIIATNKKISEKIKNDSGVDTVICSIFKAEDTCCTIIEDDVRPWLYDTYEYDAFRLKKDKTFGPITVDYEKGDLIEIIMNARKQSFKDFFIDCFDTFYQKTWDDVNKKCEEQDKIRDKIIEEINMEENRNNQSSAKELKDYRTNELLKELISRGVHMENVQVPVTVMQTINLEEL